MAMDNNAMDTCSPVANKHVHFPARRVLGNFLGHFDQIVGHVPRRRHHNHHPMAGFPFGHHPRGHVFDAVGVRHRTSPKLHYHKLAHTNTPLPTIVLPKFNRINNSCSSGFF
jgi:hypothetical protein